MSRSLNSCSFTGYLAADPRVKEFESGDKVANLRLAVARSKKDPDTGEWVDDALFIDVKAFGRQTEAIEAYLAKGSYVAVTGQLAQPRKWTTDDGETRFSIVVDHAQVSFGPRTDGEGERQAKPAPKKAAAFDDDIPFL